LRLVFVCCHTLVSYASYSRDSLFFFLKRVIHHIFSKFMLFGIKWIPFQNPSFLSLVSPILHVRKPIHYLNTLKNHTFIWTSITRSTFQKFQNYIFFLKENHCPTIQWNPHLGEKIVFLPNILSPPLLRKSRLIGTMCPQGLNQKAKCGVHQTIFWHILRAYHRQKI